MLKSPAHYTSIYQFSFPSSSTALVCIVFLQFYHSHRIVRHSTVTTVYHSTFYKYLRLVVWLPWYANKEDSTRVSSSVLASGLHFLVWNKKQDKYKSRFASWSNKCWQAQKQPGREQKIKFTFISSVVQKLKLFLCSALWVHLEKLLPTKGVPTQSLSAGTDTIFSCSA